MRDAQAFLFSHFIVRVLPDADTLTLLFTEKAGCEFLSLNSFICSLTTSFSRAAFISGNA